MNLYDAERAPAPDEWMLLDESERIELVERHHREIGDKPPEPRMHVVFHVIVEGSVLAGYLHDLAGDSAGRFDQAQYDAALKRLTAREWRDGE